MLFKRFFGQFAYPLWLFGLLVFVTFSGMGINNLMGESFSPDDIIAVNGREITMKNISPVHKRLVLAGENSSKNADDAFNPFSEGHKDWSKQHNGESSLEPVAELNLEVLGLTSIRGRKKALVRQLENKKIKAWLRVGDIFEGYTTTYISNKNIIFTKGDKQIRFALKRNSGILYSGRGKIIIAPDVDLYLESLKLEEISAYVPVNKGDEGDAMKNIATDKVTDQNSSRRVIYRNNTSTAVQAPAAINGSSTGKVNNTTVQSASESAPSSSSVDEMAFLQELKKIFSKENN